MTEEQHNEINRLRDASVEARTKLDALWATAGPVSEMSETALDAIEAAEIAHEAAFAAYENFVDSIKENKS